MPNKRQRVVKLHFSRYTVNGQRVPYTSRPKNRRKINRNINIQQKTVRKVRKINMQNRDVCRFQHSMKFMSNDQMCVDSIGETKSNIVIDRMTHIQICQ